MPEQEFQNPHMTGQSSVGTTPGSAPASAMGKADKASSLMFAEHSDFNYTLLILWLAAAFSILATLYLWWNQRDFEGAVADKKAELAAVEADLFAKPNTDAEQEANNFKASVSALTQAYNQRYSFSLFLPELYKVINKDVLISALSVSADGTVNFTGTTSSYRSIAEQVMSLKTSRDLANIELASTSVADNEGTQDFSFTIRATLVKKTADNGNAVTPSTATVDSSGTGGVQ